VRACPGKALAVSQRRRARGLHLPPEPSTTLGRAFTRGTKDYSVILKIYYPKPPGLCSDRSPWKVLSKKGRFKAYLVFGACFWVRATPFGLKLVLAHFEFPGLAGELPEGSPKLLESFQATLKSPRVRIWRWPL